MSAALLVCLLLAQQEEKRPGGGPKVGEEAPDFKAKRSGEDEHVTLHGLLRRKRKPIVLIFGSST